MSIPSSLDSRVRYGLSVSCIKLHNPYLLEFNLTNVTYIVTMLTTILLLITFIGYRIYQTLQAFRTNQSINIIYWLQDGSAALSIIVLLICGSIEFIDKDNFTNTFHVPLTLSFAVWEYFLTYFFQLMLSSLIFFVILRIILRKIKKFDLKPFQIYTLRTLTVLCLFLAFHILGFIFFVRHVMYIPVNMTMCNSHSINLELIFNSPTLPTKIILNSIEN